MRSPDKQILIIDDKIKSDKRSTEHVIAGLDAAQQSLVVHYRNATELWATNGDDIRLLGDFSPYRFVFIHDSQAERIIQSGLKRVLIRQLSVTSKVVLFSGTKKESVTPMVIGHPDDPRVSWYDLRRSQYCDNFRNFMASQPLFGDYRVKYLYDRYANPKTDRGLALRHAIRQELEESASAAAHSEPFGQLLRLFGYEPKPDILEKFSNFSDDKFLAALDRLLETKNT